MLVEKGSTQAVKTTAIKLAGYILIAGLMTTTAQAEEGGSGHYLPGSLASSIDVTVPIAGLAALVSPPPP